MWYELLNKSPLTPDAIVFKIVWPILYLLIFVSAVLYSQTDRKKWAFILLGANLLVNFCWSIVFFGLHKTLLALILLSFLLLSAIVINFEFFRNSKLTGFIFLPYTIWLFFAFYLNYYIVSNN